MTRVFYTDVDCLFDDNIFNAAKKLVTPQRLEKTEKYKFRRDRNLSLGASLILSYALSLFLDEEADKEILIAKNGKPYLKAHPNVHFSLSHSGSLALCAVSDKNIGADVQQICDFNEDICKRYFLKTEAEYVLNAKTINEKKERFFRLWTIKEATVKMTGDGISGFKNINSVIPACVKEYSLDGYKIALCTDEEEKDFEIKKINILKMLIN